MFLFIIFFIDCTVAHALLLTFWGLGEVAGFSYDELQPAILPNPLLCADLFHSFSRITIKHNSAASVGLALSGN
jgi:hypothetical protein